MRLHEFKITKGSGGDSHRDAYLLLNYDLSNRRRQALVSIQITGLNDNDFQTLQEAIETQDVDFESFGRDLGIFDDEEINNVNAESILRQ